MTRNTSASGATSDRGSSYELRFGEACLRLENVSERVQLVITATLCVAALGALSIGVLTMLGKTGP